MTIPPGATYTQSSTQRIRRHLIHRSGDKGWAECMAIYRRPDGRLYLGHGAYIAVLALGATFSALEILPLVLIGFEAYQHYTLSKSTQWIKAYKWAIYCFISICFWNFPGASPEFAPAHQDYCM